MIRKMKIEELDIVMKIWLETNMQAHDFIDKHYWQQNYKSIKKMLPASSITVYKENDAILGFVGLIDSYIAGLFVNANCQSRGIGKALLDDAKESHYALSLHVYKRNVRAVQFYL